MSEIKLKKGGVMIGVTIPKDTIVVGNEYCTIVGCYSK